MGAMRKRRIYLVLLMLAVAGVVGLSVILRPEREPEYGGKRLSEWMIDPDTNWTARVEEIHSLGTNAFPCLLRWIRYEVPDWKYAADRALRSCNKTWRFPDRKRKLSVASVVAFHVLGHEGAAAIPELEATLKQHSDLAVRCRVIVALTAIGSPAAVPTLRGLLQDPQLNVRVAATSAIQQLEPRPVQSLSP